ncbi:hypothetical protein KQI89_09415 [Clostridium sp. MSJ-4]|uniref:Uncharacterized protein n=1 Tax=Clostridium simiarum TaxID=2841506 RepID=A0ABS6F118_9CLOT|nr:hypothetical protein [Clostridium simiarum]MBU5591986.1 hypothetical protein [Clostridium simiarum]
MKKVRKQNGSFENKVEQLIDLVEKHTRTERHLEQHSDIASPENIANAEKIQEFREDEIATLKDNIANSGESYDEQLNNLKDNYSKAETYIAYNQDTMSSQDLESAKEKQRHRKEQINILE